MNGPNSGVNFVLGGETCVVSFVIADLLFVAFATWRYRSTKPPRPATAPTPITAEQVAA